MEGAAEWVQAWGVPSALALAVSLVALVAYALLARRAAAAVPASAPAAMRARVAYPWRMCALLAAVACTAGPLAQLPASPMVRLVTTAALGIVLGALLMRVVPRAAPPPPRQGRWLLRNAYALCFPYARLWAVVLPLVVGAFAPARAALAFDAVLVLALVGWHLAGMPLRFGEREAPRAWIDAVVRARQRLGATGTPLTAVAPLATPLALGYRNAFVASAGLLAACERDPEALEGAALDVVLRGGVASELRRAAALSVVALALVGAGPALAEATGREDYLFYFAALALQAWAWRGEARTRVALAAAANQLALVPTVRFRARMTEHAGLPLVLTRARGGSVYDLLVAIGEPPPFPRPAPPSWQGPLTAALLLGLASFAAMRWAMELVG